MHLANDRTAKHLEERIQFLKDLIPLEDDVWYVETLIFKQRTNNNKLEFVVITHAIDNLSQGDKK